MPSNPRGEKTQTQKLSDLVDWFLMDRQVMLEFSYNEHNKGKLIPEYDCYYYQVGRRVTERCLAMQMMTEFLTRDFKYSLSQIISALTAKAWEHYVNNYNPPEWVANQSLPIAERRPRGRPRTKLRKLALPSPTVVEAEAQPVNT
jgi:hypothetical protein